MDIPRLAVLVLTLAAFGLPAFAALSAYSHARSVIANVDGIARDFMLLRQEWAEATASIPKDLLDEQRTQISREINEFYHDRFAAQGLPVPSFENFGTEAFHVTAATVRLIFSGNGGNAAIALLGLACGLAASIWSLFLPGVNPT